MATATKTNRRPEELTMTKSMTLKIGSRLKVQVASLAEAQAAYCATRDESGEGGSTFPDGRVGKFRISYNGRAWLDGKPVDGLTGDQWVALATGAVAS